MVVFTTESLSLLRSTGLIKFFLNMVLYRSTCFHSWLKNLQQYCGDRELQLLSLQL